MWYYTEIDREATLCKCKRQHKKTDTIGLIIKIIIAVLTGLASALGLASCMSAAGMTGFMHTL